MAALEERHGLTPMAGGGGGNILCTDRNHTHFEIPDPDAMPEEARAAILELVSSRLAQYALGY